MLQFEILLLYHIEDLSIDKCLSSGYGLNRCQHLKCLILNTDLKLHLKSDPNQCCYSDQQHVS